MNVPSLSLRPVIPVAVTETFAARDREATIVALATPPGTSALALIRVTGSACRRLAADIFGRDPQTLPHRRAVYGRYRAGIKSGAESRSPGATSPVLDDLVWVFAAGPGTATGEDTLELSCHGNPLIVQLILADLYQRGCSLAEPGEFTRRAFLNGKLELTQAEAVIDLIHARSERALAAARHQLQGDLGRQLEILISRVLSVLAQIEAYIDFPDEDLPPENRQRIVEEVEDVLRGTTRLLATHRYGDLLRDGLKAVLLGAPNAGKSSLLNALVGYERALVSPEPGTTRDFIEERLQVGPHLLRLMDTAGLNPAPTGAVERQGIAKTAERLAEADLVLWVLDATLPCPTVPVGLQDPSLLGKILVVWNKVDLSEAVHPAADVLAQWPVVSVSALTGRGLPELREQIVQKADNLGPPAFKEEQIAINARHADALRRAELGLAAAVRGLTGPSATPAELVSGDVRAALDALGEIAGRVDNERMLDALFANFCIGK